MEPVEFTSGEVEVLKSLARNLGQPATPAVLLDEEQYGESFEDIARRVVREELEKLGLVKP